MILIPGKRGTMHLVHHGFECNTKDGFALAFAHGSLGDCTAFKTISREGMVALIAGNDEGGERAWNAPSLESMLGAESPAAEFGTLDAEANGILTKLPNHCFITPKIFIDLVDIFCPISMVT